MAHADRSESIFDSGQDSGMHQNNNSHQQGSERINSDEQNCRVEHEQNGGEEVVHDELMEMHQSSRSILDQVDDFLKDHHHEHENGSEQGNQLKDELPSSHSGSTWIPSNMQVDLDHLSHSLFTHQNGAEQRDHHDMDLDIDYLDKEGNGTQQGHGVPGSGVIGPHHIRPDMVVSPMVSPMMMPGRSNSQSSTPFLGHNNNNNQTNSSHNSVNGSYTNDGVYSYASNRSNQWKNKNGSQFSPLSSPALTAIDNAQRINFALPESSLNSATRKKSARAKRRTSGNSINSSASSSSTTKVVKNSPHLGSNTNSSRRHTKNSPVTANGNNSSWDDLIFKLPESSIEVNNNLTNANTTTDGITPKSSSSGVLSSSPESRMTPATLMNYPKVILPSNTLPTSRHDRSTSPNEIGMVRSSTCDFSTNNNDNNRSFTNDNSNNNNENNNNNNNSGAQILRATESPVIKPRPPIPLSRNGSKLKIDELPSSLSSSTTMPMAIPEAQQKPQRSKRKVSVSSSLNGGGSSDDGDLIKKEVHKAAEQGRRNRLNSALNDLDSLLPQKLKESITIPSKATTVELACTYIRQLLDAKNSPNTQG